MNDVGPGQSETVELVKTAQAGDKAAFDRLVQLHQRQAMGLAVGMLANVHDAAEVVQEAFVKSYVGLEGLSRPERFRFWLLKIVANEAVSRCRAARRRRMVTRLFVAAEAERQSAGVQDEGNADELREAVERAMRQLTAREAEAITLFGLDDLPHQEVGRIMGCSAGSVR
jgi:RNA polymerase sigma-70 factor (ECF subfamily)